MVILGASQFFLPSTPPPGAGSGPTTEATPLPGSAPGTQKATEQSGSSASSLPRPSRAAASHVPAMSVTIDTDEYTAVFSSRGAVLTGFRLKKYLNRQTDKPFQLVNADPTHPKPFTLDYSPIPGLNESVFEVKGTSQKLEKPGQEARLVFRYVDPYGRVLEKIFGFKNGSYLIDLDMTVTQTGKGALPSSDLILEWADTLGKEENTGTNSRVQGYHVETLTGDHMDSQSTKKSQESSEIPAPVSWTALANQFFVAAMVPDPSTGGASVRVVRDQNVYKSPTQEDPNPGVDTKIFAPRPELVFPGQALKSGESFQRKCQVFIGPQDYNLLKGLNLNLERVIDFGFFRFFSVYMLRLLQWFYLWGHNWGLAIILLSIVVKLLLWLPTHNSYKNMYLTQHKMREVQPKLDALKRKYPDDKQKQQQEQMRLFNEAGINPLGGCLPMLFQLPVFWALYATLGHCIELRGASFLWLHDLTLKDPYYVLPLLMGGTMILQQKVSGQMATQAAGQQKVMMWMMPVVLTFISTKWPAGLLVYWVVTNLLSMIQQKVVNREIQKAKKKDEGAKP
jgi:YidC/Oxa1 family membrane protein insertase